MLLLSFWPNGLQRLSSAGFGVQGVCCLGRPQIPQYIRSGGHGEGRVCACVYKCVYVCVRRVFQ